MCTNSLINNQLYLEKDYEIEKNNSSSRIIYGDWVTNRTTSDGTIWIPLEKAPGYGGLSMKTDYNQDIGYSLSGPTFLTCSFFSLEGTDFELEYTNIESSKGKQNYILYGEVNRIRLDQVQVGTNATRIRYIVTNSVIDVDPRLETGRFSTTTSSGDTKILKNSTTVVTKSLTSSYTISSCVTYDYGLNCSISATGSKAVKRYYKQYSNEYYYRVGLNALNRKTFEY